MAFQWLLLIVDPDHASALGRSSKPGYPAQRGAPGLSSLLYPPWYVEAYMYCTLLQCADTVAVNCRVQAESEMTLYTAHLYAYA